MPKILLSRCFFTVLTFAFQLQVCVCECVPGVFAKRKNFYIPEGGSVSLWCDVQHCERYWTGGWGIRQESVTFLTPSQRVHLSNAAIAHGTTRLYLNIHNLNQSDSGAYQCNINWEDSSSQGHVQQINVTAGSMPEKPPGRTLSDRLLIYAAVSLCFVLALALTLTRCFISNRRPPPPVPAPRSRNSSTARVKPKADVVYAALSLNHPRQQSASETPTVNTTVVYSTVNHSRASSSQKHCG